ncbi:MAG: hypothetical protein CMJ18_11515 [Phycisphaeraceae bacterium]|nr:hypothetical protein [Phycisphaeraceae bacterium]
MAGFDTGVYATTSSPALAPAWMPLAPRDAGTAPVVWMAAPEVGGSRVHGRRTPWQDFLRDRERVDLIAAIR